MSAHPSTRVAVANRWIRIAVAALFLASGASLLAQDNKDKEKEKTPPPAHKTTPNKKAAPPAKNEPNHEAAPPAKNEPNAPNHAAPTPANRPPMNNERPPNAVNRAPMAGSARPVYHGANGAEVHYRPNGQPAVVHARGYTITHTATGVRQAEFVRPDHSVIVTAGAHYGYVQRPYVVGGVTFQQRTYFVNNRPYVAIYRPYSYHGVVLNVYVAPRYYSPAFYTYAYSPWPRPVAFSFGWGVGTPWFGFYAGYFAPYPTYAGPAYYLTDYMMAMQLQAAYQQQMDAQAAAQAQAQAQYGGYPGGQPAVSPQVKQAIADEVQRQLNEERMDSQMGSAPASAPDFLTDNSTHVFVVADGIDVQAGAGQCALTQGDVIQMAAPPPPNAAAANLVVLASKGQDCPRGSAVAVAIPDLQNMQNNMRATLDQGLADLQAHQGQNGIPAEPAAAQAPPTQPAYAAAAPPPDPNIASEVSQQSQQAAQADAEVLNQAQSAPAAVGGAPASISLGMSIDQVVQMMGQPQMIGDLGSKKVYSYGNMKVVFVDGKVSDIQ